MIYATLQAVQEQLPEAQLPFGMGFMRWFFGASQGMQIALVSAGVVAVLVLLGAAFVTRRSLAVWLSARARFVQVGLAVLVLLVATATIGASRSSWDYMQHDNEFCTGCHVMGPAFDRFTQSGHAELSCHDCHQQSIFASMRQLREWVRDRPEEIGEHAPVPNEICARCHIDDDPEENWFQIANTAGHVAHLESDSTALADLQCVTCHGQEVHRFMPADQTCGQANCHAEESTQIVLGEMTEEAGLHCVTCHEFTAESVAPTAVDSATGPLTPGLSQCTSCHEMEELWADYDPLLDPHDAQCGACHNPHEQETPELALRSCTSAGCHARPDTLSTFHIGIGDVVETGCTECHQPHVWVRDGNDCASCHTDVLGAAASAPLPEDHPAVSFASTRRLATPAAEARVERGAPPSVTYRHTDVDRGVSPAGSSFSAPRNVQDPFSHAQHRSVSCTECHSNSRRHGEVTVRTQSDCFSCHHATSTASAEGCGSCHGPAELGVTREVTSTLRLSVREEALVRALPFDHDGHGDLRCVDCHGGGTRQRVQTTCANCHEDHHPSSGDVSCASCHESQREPVHSAQVHVEGCTGSGCHSEARFDRMERTRSFCLTCHENMSTHEPQEACLVCHLVPVDDPAVRSGPRQ